MTELYFAWISLIARLHGGLLAILPDGLALAVWSLPMAALVMGLYRWLSPQAELVSLVQEMMVLQKKMLSLQTTPEEASVATQRYLTLSVQRLRRTLVPVVLSSLPVWPVWAGLSAFYASNPQVFGVGPEWMRHWLLVFCVLSVLFSFLLKVFWRLK